MIYRITYGFSGAGEGWAETHAQQQATTDPVTLAGMHLDIMQKRANFLGAPFQLVACRIAKFFDEVLQQRARGSFLIKQIVTSAQPQITGAAEPGTVAIISRGAPNVSDPVIAARFAGAANQTFLGAPPDDAVTNGGVILQGAAGLGAALAAWRTQMIGANMGWLATRRVDDVKLESSTQNLDGTITFELKRAPLGGPGLNVKTFVRVRGVNNGRSPLNGQMLGTFTAATTFVTSDVIGIALAQVGGFLRVYDPLPQFLAYGGMQVEGITGEHKRGRPFGSPRGRAPRRVRG